MMQCLKFRILTPSPFPLTFSAPKHLLRLSPSSSKSFSQSPKMSSQTIEHIVLFKVKDNAEPSKVNAMVSSLNGLISLDPVLHLTAGPVLRTRSSPVPFTHMLHSRYSSKDGLTAYTVHPDHMSTVKEFVLPNCDDIMAVDWVADDHTGQVAPSPGSVLRVSFLKLKENFGEEVKGEILGVIKEIKDKFGAVDQITCGENFSPARAKGFSIASLAVFPGVSELDKVDSNEELVNSQKEKVRDYLDGVIVVDYVVPAPQSACL